jgi:uncharacterized protein YbaP (TraB family)
VWRVEGENSVVYLLGTMYVANGSVYPFSEQLNDIILGSDAIVFESNLGDIERIDNLITAIVYGVEEILAEATFEEMVQFGQLLGSLYYADYIDGSGSGLSGYIPAELFDRLIDAYLIFYALDEYDDFYEIIETLEICRPWALVKELTANTLDNNERLALLPDSIEKIVFDMAANARIPIIEVDGITFRADLFNSMDIELQIEKLREVLEVYMGETSLAQNETERMLAMLNAWRRRDPDAFEAAAGLDITHPRTAFMLERMNARMYDSALDLLTNHEGQFVFAVDAMHMISEIGLVERFIRDGFDVQLAAR